MKKEVKEGKEKQKRKKQKAKQTARIAALRHGDRAKWFFRRAGAPDGVCDDLITALKLVTKLIKGNKLGVEVKGVADNSKNRVTEALASLISRDNARALGTMGELAQFKRDHQVVLPTFNNEVHTEAKVIEGGEVFVDSSPEGARVAETLWWKRRRSLCRVKGLGKTGTNHP